MGKIVSKNKDQNDDEREIRKYEEMTESSPYGYGLQDTEDLKKITWWQRLIFDLRYRIIYAIIIAVVLGVSIPVVVHLLFYNSSDSTIYGSCLIKTEARFQCLINNGKPVKRQECVEANCCWEENDDLPFKCFHSFPSAYQYRVTEIKQLSGDDGNIDEDGIQLTVNPNHEDRMNKLVVLIKWLKNHLNLQIFNPNHYPKRGIMTVFPTTDKKMPRSIEKNGIIINYADENDYFFIEIVRTGSNGNETIFDTRLGPINGGNGFIAFTTTLPTAFFYGLTGGEGISSKGTISYGAMNGFENAEMPFYMSLDESNSWHGLLIETTLPFMTQVLQAPAIGFHLEGPTADLNLHFFMGPTQSETLNQLHSYLSEKISNEEEGGNTTTQILPYIPTYWGLGLHLCRQSFNSSQAWSQIKELNEITNPNTGERRIPYDSDCIDEDLRHPFGIDYENFPSAELENIIKFLKEEAFKKILFSQKIAIPYKENETDISDISEFLLMDKTNQSYIRPYMFIYNNQTVIYPDIFHPDIFNNLSLWHFDFGHNISLVDGLVLVDNFPKNEAIANNSCRQPSSFLQKLLYASSSLLPDPDSTFSSSSSANKTNPWGSLCPEILHTVSLDENGESIEEKTHLELHNVYGLQTMKKFRDILISLIKKEEQNPPPLLSTSSSWTESSYFGANNGMASNFTWIGLRESVAHILRHFILSSVTTTSVCGSFLPNEYPVMDNNLCLRWYQFSLLLPFSYHNYARRDNDTSEGNGRGPLSFPRRYQGYLREAIRQRYTYAPYYYTLLINYQQNFVPMILPMSYLFHNVRGVDRVTIFKLLDQFMIGESILAAPILKPELNRETYFTPGIWYDADGFVAWNDTQNGGFKTVTGYLVQTPLFLRGGHIIPTLQNPIGNSIEQSRAGNYTLLVMLLPNLPSYGLLYADNGMNGMNGSVPIFSEIHFEVRNQFRDTQVQINATISVVEAKLMCESPMYSTIIDQIKFLGFPHRFNNITASYQEQPEIVLETVPGDELDYLRIGHIAMNWCEENITTIQIVARMD